MIATLCLLAAATLMQSSPAAFAPVAKGLAISGVESTSFHSKHTGQDYHVHVALPPTYGSSDRKYPVLYVPDLEDIFLGAKAAYGTLDLARSLSMGRKLEEFIIVGVPLQVADPMDWARRRTPDLTPTHDKPFEEQFSKQMNAPVRGGGAALFLRALREELIPFIESRYRVTQDRGLAGYSLGGLFTAWVWLSGDTTFSRFLIGSPSLWWDKQSILQQLDPERKLKGRVFLSMGGAESKSTMLEPFQKLVATLKDRKDPDLQWESVIFDGTDHLTGIVGAFARGMRSLYILPPAAARPSGN
jgi:predicted alpha/beta superfamily hydrolase